MHTYVTTDFEEHVTFTETFTLPNNSRHLLYLCVRARMHVRGCAGVCVFCCQTNILSCAAALSVSNTVTTRTEVVALSQIVYKHSLRPFR